MSPRRTADIGLNKPTGSEHFNGKSKKALEALEALKALKALKGNRV
ncbi:MAG TPA: hypothetical protein VJ650_03800 [Gemmatimonadaceae bacterium]|nr:hypothetical protein [Gemmatimonadaceae bacterium]